MADLLGPGAHGIIRGLVPLQRLSLAFRRDVLAMAPLVLTPVAVRLTAADEFTAAVAGYCIPVALVACVFMALFEHWTISVRVWARYTKVSALTARACILMAFALLRGSRQLGGTERGGCPSWFATTSACSWCVRRAPAPEHPNPSRSARRTMPRTFLWSLSRTRACPRS